MAETLKSGTNTPEVEQEVKAAAEDKFPDANDILTFFEHDQWFIEVDDGEEFHNYSVVDCVNQSGEEYLDFEEL
jgi:hypothetical protein